MHRIVSELSINRNKNGENILKGIVDSWVNVNWAVFKTLNNGM
jgi:hypothetical protein